MGGEGGVEKYHIISLADISAATPAQDGGRYGACGWDDAVLALRGTITIYMRNLLQAVGPNGASRRGRTSITKPFPNTATCKLIVTYKAALSDWNLHNTLRLLLQYGAAV